MIGGLGRVDGATVAAGFPDVAVSRTDLSEDAVLGTDIFATTLGTAFFPATSRLGAATFAAGLRDVDFGAEMALIFADADFLAAIFLAVGVLAPLAVFWAPLLTDAVLTDAALPAGLRLTATFPAAIFSVRPFGFPVRACDFAVPPRALFSFADAGFTWETFTSPRMAGPDGRAFAAAAFAVGRRIGLLRGVEAMGNALVTVATW
jgi:hypothetical protein